MPSLAASRRVRALAGLAGISLATVAVSACASDNDGSAPSSSPTGSAGASGTATKTGAKTVTVTVTEAAGCTPDSTTLAAGGVTFKVTNTDASAVSEVELVSGERIVGEVENLPPGLSGSFSVTVEAGDYTLYCPGASTERTSMKAVGSSSTNTDASTKTLLASGTKQWGEYVTTQVGYLVDTSKALTTALAGTDLAAAQTAYVKARPYYERIEPVAESFVSGKDNLDTNIDIREGDVPASQWQGFHRIEKGLYTDKSLKGLAAYGTKLVANCTKLKELVTDLTYKPFELINGAQELLNEVATGKVTGEEERYSRIDLLDFAANVEGAEQAFAALKPALVKLNAATTAAVSDSFDDLTTLLDKYRTKDNASGFMLYNTLTKADIRKLAAAVAGVQEPLAKVAKTVANS